MCIRDRSKVASWAKDNKICFNEEKLKVMLVSRRKRREINEYKYTLRQGAGTSMQHQVLGILINDNFKFSDHNEVRSRKMCQINPYAI